MSDEREARIEKVEKLRAAGIDPYPTRSRRDTTAAAALAHFEAWSAEEKRITLAGRLMQLRRQGKTTFAHIEDDTARIQVYIKQDAIGEEAYQRIKLLDPGDFVEASGPLFTTHTGEPTLRVERFTLLAKALEPLPAKGAGGDLKLFDPETRHRKRYLDLLANREEEFPIFIGRAKTLQAIRDFLNARGYIEVQTPALQPLYGGASARPFITHHNTLDRDLYLRIALELYLKRLLVGGFERVYELGSVFRNEGIDRNHNPEFTLLELYEAYSDYEGMARLTEELVAYAAQQVTGGYTFDYQGTTIDVTPPWRRVTLREIIAQYLGIDYDDYPTREGLLAAIRERGIAVDPNRGRGRLIDELMDEVFKRHGAELRQPMFLMDYPADMLPLAKRIPDRLDTAEAFQAFAGGLQLAKAFTELNDPLDQRARFEDQARQLALGDAEAQTYDEDFIEALEVGMPPAGGNGIGVDRLVMLLTNQETIREVILFPTMREQPR